MMYFCFLSLCGIFINIWLHIDDVKNRDSILNRVDKGDNLAALMTSPTGPKRREFNDPNDNDDDEMKLKEYDSPDEMQKNSMKAADDSVKQSLLSYTNDKSARDALRRSMAK